MSKRQLDLKHEDEQNIVVILERYPYLRGNITSAVSLALFELAAKITLEQQYSPAPILPDESKNYLPKKETGGEGDE